MPQTVWLKRLWALAPALFFILWSDVNALGFHRLFGLDSIGIEPNAHSVYFEYGFFTLSYLSSLIGGIFLLCWGAGFPERKNVLKVVLFGQLVLYVVLFPGNVDEMIVMFAYLFFWVILVLVWVILGARDERSRKEG